MAKRGTFNEINITPLTDIFLVLLIIMMVIAPMLDQQGLNLSVPEYVKSESTKESKILTITVDNNNQYIIDGQNIPVSQLDSVISEQSKTMTDGVMIQTEDNTEHGAVVKVMDIARNKGVSNISLTQI